MNAFFQFLSDTLDPLAALVLVVFSAISAGLISQYWWHSLNRKRQLYLNAPNLSLAELTLMLNNEFGDEQEKQIAQEILDELPENKQQALAAGFALHNTVQRFTNHRLWRVYRGLAQRTLYIISVWFNERQLQPKLNTVGVRLFPDPVTSTALPQVQTIHWKRWFSFQSYLLLLLLAFTYPFLLALINSLETSVIGLAGTELIRFNHHKPVAWFVVLLMVSGLFAMKWMNNLFREASFIKTWSWLGAFTALNLLVTIPVYGDVAFAVVVAGLVIVAFAVAVTVGFTGSGTFAFAFSYVLKHIELKGNRRVLFSVFIINAALLLYYAAMLFMLKEYGEEDKQHMLLLPVFLGILPLTNGLFDWLSFNVTRLLCYKILHNRNSALTNIGLGLLGGVSALLFALMVITTILVILTGINHLFASHVVDLPLLMHHLGKPTQISEHYWILAMVLSTLLPSLFHLILVCYSLLLSGVMFWKRTAIDAFLSNSLTEPHNRSNLLLYVQFRWLLMAFTAVGITSVIYLISPQISQTMCSAWLYADGLAQFADNLFGSLSGQQWYTPAASVCKV